MNKKTCSKCKTEKGISEFWRDKSHVNGIRSRCKTCSIKIVKNKNCFFCKKSFKPYTTLDKFCSLECRVNNQKSKRNSNWSTEKAKNITGENNPAYRNGMYCRKNKKSFKGERDFLRNAKEIKQGLINDYGYIHCENCKSSDSLRFETHHIIFRSEKPLHEHLHKKDNLIVLCIKCHNAYHKSKGKRNELVVERGLNKLFGNDVLNKNICA